MKNRFLLLAIPALVVLSGCNNASTSGMSKATKVFVDDCFAHEESFGEAGELVKFNSGIRRAAPTVDGVGVQMSDDGTKMRFVATVDNPESVISATWTRNIVSLVNGVEVRPESTKSPTGYYTIINDGGVAANAPTGKGFVVYTITNIPENAKSAISVNLKLENVDGTTYSNTYVVNANSGAELGTYGRDESSFTLSKFMGGTKEQDENTIDPENNFASFTISLNKDEVFNIYGHDGINHKFVVVSASKLTGDASNYFFEENPGKFIKANYSADYILYLNKSLQLYTSATNVVRKISIDFSDVTWWRNGAYTYLYAFNNTNGKKSLLSFENVENNANRIITSDTVNPKEREGLIVLRAISGTITSADQITNWNLDEHQEGRQLYNQTVDINLKDNGSATEVIKILDQKDGDKNKISFI